MLDGFKMFKDQNPSVNSKLLLHTHWDEGWDIPRLIEEKGIDNFDNPNRVLVNLVEIEKYFMSEFSDRFYLEEIWWLDYTRGRAYLKTGNVIEAKKSLNIVLFSGSPLIYKLKSLYFLLVILPFNRP